MKKNIYYLRNMGMVQYRMCNSQYFSSKKSFRILIVSSEPIQTNLLFTTDILQALQILPENLVVISVSFFAKIKKVPWFYIIWFMGVHYTNVFPNLTLFSGKFKKFVYSCDEKKDLFCQMLELKKYNPYKVKNKNKL